MDERLFWIWLSTVKGIGPVTARKLLDKFKSPYEVYNASQEELECLYGPKSSLVSKILSSKCLKEAQNILKRCDELAVNLLTCLDCKYPEEVKKLNKAPIILYYKGSIKATSMGVGIVGARRCSDYGKKVAVEAAEFLADNNIPVISGMAKGIDSYAQTACINKGGYTIAILGNSVDVCYPKEHIKLMNKIIDYGAVISKYPPTTNPSKLYFPERNYLISAWSNKLLVVEAGEKSGSLITAESAKNQGREVYVVPNNIYAKESIGTNNLILNGATIYLKPKQLVMESGKEINIISISRNELISDENISTIERKILNWLKDKPRTIEEIIILLKETSSNVIETIAMMELENKITCKGIYYHLVSSSFS